MANILSLLAAIIIITLSHCAKAKCSEYSYSHSDIKEDSLCGGTILGPNGTISYMGINSEPIQCIWTLIPGAVHHEITITHELGNLNLGNDSLTFTVININSALKPFFMDITDVINSPVSLDGGLGLIIFQTTSINVGKQFKLEYKATNYWNDPPRPINGFYSMNDIGSVHYPPNGEPYKANELSTFVISNPRYNRGENLQLNIDFVNMDPECTDFIRVFEILDKPISESCWLCNPEQEIYIIREISSKICGSNAGYGFNSNSGFLIIFQSDDYSQGQGFTGFGFNWKNTDRLPETSSESGVTFSPIDGAVTTCGGIISGSSGTIEYKIDEEYLPNEMCTWTIRADGFERMSFEKELSGLVGGEDVITITAFDMDVLSHGPIETRFLNSTEQLNVNWDGPETISLYGQLFIVVFISNHENQGPFGFRLNFNAYKEEFVYGVAHEDVGSYSPNGSVSLNFGHDGWFSSFVVSPNETTGNVEDFQVELIENVIDIGPPSQCNFHGLFIFEIMPSSSDIRKSGTLEFRTILCGLTGKALLARRGFFGFLVIIQQYSYDGGSVFLDYNTKFTKSQVS